MLKEAKGCLVAALNENGYQVPGDIGINITCPETFVCEIALIFHRHIIEGTKSLGPKTTLVREEGVQIVAHHLNEEGKCGRGKTIN